MKNLKKKGFTIVELVIVIAVIAILSAVLIPTFSGLVKKANLSADEQTVRQMNIALAIEGNPTNINGEIDVLADAGYNSKDTLQPFSTCYGFYWRREEHIIILVKDGVVVYPKDKEYTFNGISLANSVKYIDVKANNAYTLLEAINNGSMDIILCNDIIISKGEIIRVYYKNIIIDLNGKTLSTKGPTINIINVEEGGTLTIKDGIINYYNSICVSNLAII